MKRIINILLVVFLLSVLPTTYACAQIKQDNEETRQKRKAQRERETAAKKERRQQESLATLHHDEKVRRKHDAEENAKKKRVEAERPFRELEENMVFVEGGTFMMGATNEQDSAAYHDEKPVHQVTLSSFSICKYEVTQELWQAVMGNNPSYSKGKKLPVERVSWEDCQLFVDLLNQKTGKHYRLPTEAEWEYAARGGNQSKGYKYAGSDSLDIVGWYDNQKKKHEVGTKQANELGLYDMSGNVWEWCSDGYGKYDATEQTNPQGTTSSSTRVFRGGSWSSEKRLCRVSHRGDFTRSFRSNDLGFRLAQ